MGDNTTSSDEETHSRLDERSSKKKSKKEKKSKKDKKHKKEKKSKKSKKRSNDFSASSSPDSEGAGNEWVEKDASVDPSIDSTISRKDASSSIQRDEWMTAPCMFACVTRDQLRAKKEPTEKQKEQEAAKYMLDRPGQSERELNPYWADNGTGLPSEKPPEPESLSLNSTTVGDQGVSWLRRALKRAQEQAAESGRSLEDVAAERWGSLQKLEDLLSEAEGRRVCLSQADVRRRDYHRGDQRGGRADSHGNGGRRYNSERSDERKQTSERRYGSDGAKERYEDRSYKERSRNSITSHDRIKPRFARPGEDYHSSRQDKDQNSSKGDEDSNTQHRLSMLDGRSKLGFRKPEESDKDLKSFSEYRQDSGSSGSRGWKKKEANIKVSETKIRNDEIEKVEKKEQMPPPEASSSESESETGSSKEANIEHGPEILSDQQMNELAAKLMKAEILGNEDLVAALKKKLEQARQVRAANPGAAATSGKSKKSEAEVVILTRTDSKGFARPLQTNSAHPEPTGGRRKKQKAETHSADGHRARYFPDDDKFSLQDMFQREKLTTAEDQNEIFIKLAGKDKRQEHDLDMDDVFSERAREKESDGKLEARERGRAINEHKRKERMLDSCRWCFDGKELQRHLIVAVGVKSYVCLPPYQSITEGHCLIIPLHHTTCATQLDEDVWDEMQDFRKALVSMFRADDEDCVLFETAMYLNKFPHMVWHCIPLPQEIGDMAPIYFKKAILECETEWSTNKKIVDLSKKDVRHSVPKGLPYFAVDFGNEGGFAHVIEEEKNFPTNFAQEIIGGMMDLDHTIWRKPRIENFEKQRRKVIHFSKKWRNFDFTKQSNDAKRMKKEDSDSDD